MSEDKYHGMSPLPLEEKQAIIKNEYAPRVHRVGLLASLGQAVIIFLPALFLLAAYGLWPGWGTIGEALGRWRRSVPLTGLSSPYPTS